MQLAAAMRERIKEGHFAMGTFVVELRTPALARFLQQAHFDFLLVDNEHGYWNPLDIAQQIDAGKRWGVCPLVRVSGPDRGEIMRALDAGAEGVMVPMANTVADVERAVEYSKYPPLGQRGAAFHMAHDGYVGGDVLQKMRSANDEVVLIAQIENRPGLENVERIAAIDGIDILWIGQFDLSNFLGIPGQFEHPTFLGALERVVTACERHGKTAAFMVPSVDEGLERMRQGFRCIAYWGDLWIYQQGLKQGVAALKDGAWRK